ncbi:MAG: type II secretion system protein GspG [Kiritimatiellae bacterium]|nr:type II secretion system protein GspG [Kiritimatiellia bacterium]
MNETKKSVIQRGHEGFTLIEILLVVVIIAILASLAIPRLGGRVREARTAAARTDIESIGTALRLYELDNGAYPSSLQGLITSSGSKNWKGPYLDKGTPKDPWGNGYVYQFPGQNNSHGYDLKSLGPDGSASGDDIANWDTPEN